MREARGAALIDMIVAVALCFIMAGIAVPVVGGTLERERALVGSRYLAGQLQRARLESLKRNQSVAVRLEIVGDRTQFRLYADANGNGVLQKDIDKGVDAPLAPPEWLDIRTSGNVLSFVDTLYSEESLAARITAVVGNARTIDAQPIPLRSIFTTLARATRDGSAAA